MTKLVEFMARTLGKRQRAAMLLSDAELRLKSNKGSAEMSSFVRDSATGGNAAQRKALGEEEPPAAEKRSSESPAWPGKLIEIKPTQLQSSAAYVNERLLGNLPNDLTRLVYLASIRDNNTGTYLHPQLSRQYDARFADQVLRSCHEQVFGKVLAVPIRQYVIQMSRYIQFTGADQREVIATWKSLQAYRAAVPMNADRLSVEVFCLHVDTALMVLEEALRGTSAQHTGE